MKRCCFLYTDIAGCTGIAAGIAVSFIVTICIKQGVGYVRKFLVTYHKARTLAVFCRSESPFFVMKKELAA